MATKAGYWVDLFSLKFDDSQTDSWIQAMPLGTYEHPVHGTIDITPERVGRFADNVKKNVRGQQLDIDYDHKEYGGEAAGWVKDAEARPDGLWLLIEWTKKAYDAIKSKAYRYFSPEFNDEWTHPKTQQSFKDVLFGGGLTNRPFLKDILPINMSEVFAYNEGNNQPGGKMVYTPEQLAELRKKYSLSDDASVEDILAAAIAESPSVSTPDPVEAAGTETPALSEDMKKLAEASPTVKKLMEIVEAQGAQITAQATQLSETAALLREAEIGVTVTKLSETASKKGFALAPTATQALSEVLLSAPKELGDKIVQAFDKVINGVVELGERGRQRHSDDGRPASERMAEAVTKLQESDKSLSYADAVVRVASTDPMLFADYQDESYAYKV